MWRPIRQEMSAVLDRTLKNISGQVIQVGFVAYVPLQHFCNHFEDGIFFAIYITISTYTSVCPYGVRRHVTSRPTSDFYHGQSFRRPVRPLLSEAKPSYVYSILKPHGQSFRNPNCCSQQHSITSPCGFRIE